MRWWVPWQLALALAAAQALWLPLLLGIGLYLPSLPSPAHVRSSMSRRVGPGPPHRRSDESGAASANRSSMQPYASQSSGSSRRPPSLLAPAARQTHLMLAQNLSLPPAPGSGAWVLSLVDRFYHRTVATVSQTSSSPASSPSSFEYPAEHLLIKALPPFSTETRQLLPRDVVATGMAYQRWDRRRFKQQRGRYWRGNRVKNGSDTKNINKIWIWGERNSCTTLVTEILKANFKLHCSSQRVDCVIGGLPWKHGFMRHADLQQQEETLNILVTRSPYEWLESMHRHPFYAELHRGVDMPSFLAREWITFKTEAIDKVHTERRAEVVSDRSKPPQTAALLPASPCLQLTDQLDDSEACLLEDRLYHCTHLPGLSASSKWITRKKLQPLEECLGANVSHVACSSEFLCSGLSRTSIFANYSLQQWRDRLAHYIHSQWEESPTPFIEQVRSSKDLDLEPNKWRCELVPGYRVDTSNELAPSPFCLDGNMSWGRCLKGGFLCRVNATRQGLWHQPAQWHLLKQQLVAAAKEVTQHVNLKKVNNVQFLKAGMSLDPPLAKLERLEDRDPDTGKRFPNILAMRAAKLRDWFLTADRNLSFTSHMACRDFFVDPIAILDELRRDFNLEPTAPEWQLSQCIMHFGEFMCPKAKNKKNKQYSWSAPEAQAKRSYYINGTYAEIYKNISLHHVNAWLDEELENALGYSIYRDFGSLSTPYTLDNRCSHHFPRQAAADLPCYRSCHACQQESSRGTSGTNGSGVFRFS